MIFFTLIFRFAFLALLSKKVNKLLLYFGNFVAKDNQKQSKTKLPKWNEKQGGLYLVTSSFRPAQKMTSASISLLDEKLICNVIKSNKALELSWVICMKLDTMYLHKLHQLDKLDKYEGHLMGF